METSATDDLESKRTGQIRVTLTGILAPESSNVTNVFHPAQASLDGSSYKPLSSLPSVGYQPSGAASNRAKTQQKTKVSFDVIVLSDEESPTSPMEFLKNLFLISAHQKNATPGSAQSQMTQL